MGKGVLIAGISLLLLWTSGFADTDYVRDAAERVKVADWSKMEIVSVILTEHRFVPAHMSFKKDVPYKLSLKNEGSEKHYFVSEGFFKAIATRKVQSTDGEIKAPYLDAIEVYPGRAIELYFIPVKEGNYDLLCTIEGHAEKGMRGKISIK
jgi:uncharacterized cupredoxin-like copper-binding protein